MSRRYETDRPEYQRRRFPCKFNEDLCREITLRYSLGDSIAEIRAWVTEDKHISCSYNAIRHVLLRKRWGIFRTTIMISEMQQPWLQEMLEEYFKEKWAKFCQLEKQFLEAIEEASKTNPNQVQGFMNAVKLLNKPLREFLKKTHPKPTKKTG